MHELADLVGSIAAWALASAEWLVGSLLTLYSAGMPNSLSPGELAVGAAAGGAAGGAAAAGGANNGPPRPPMSSTVDHQMGQYRYRDSSGNAYWPGISAIPGDGIIYQRENRFNNDLARHNKGGGWHPDPLPVDRGTGRVVWPPPGKYEGTASISSAGRG